MILEELENAFVDRNEHVTTAYFFGYGRSKPSPDYASNLRELNRMVIENLDKIFLQHSAEIPSDLSQRWFDLKADLIRAVQPHP